MLTENSPLLTNLKMLWIRVLWGHKWGLQIHMWHSGPAATFLGHCKVPVEFCSNKFWKDKRLTLFINKTHTRTCQFTLSLTEGYAEYLFTVSASLLSWPFDMKEVCGELAMTFTPKRNVLGWKHGKHYSSNTTVCLVPFQSYFLK